MTRRQRRFDDADFDFGDRRGRSSGVGTILLATALGVGIGLLAAPDTGVKTRRRLRKRLETLGEDLGGGLEEMQGLSGRARERMRERLAQMRKRGEDAWEDLEHRWHAEEEEEDDDSGALGAALAVAAGIAATYFLTSDRAAPARSRVKETAESMRREARHRWEEYQQHRHEAKGNGQTGAGETRSTAIPSDESPHAG
jgi:gas vesicle protein